MHLTLRFLGEIKNGARERLWSQMAAGVGQIAPFTLELRGLGVFPNAKHPKVLWVAVEGAGVSSLVGLNNVAEGAARSVGLNAEKRAFRPHLTLARIRPDESPTNLAAILNEAEIPPGSSFSVTSVSLFQSTLTPQGAIHERLAQEILREATQE
jgi:2'-5' RNA ligase